MSSIVAVDARNVSVRSSRVSAVSGEDGAAIAMPPKERERSWRVEFLARTNVGVVNERHPG